MKPLVLSIVLSVLLTSTCWAEELRGTDQRKLLRMGQFVLEEIQDSPDYKIPKRLISRAKAVIIFPTMVKKGFALARSKITGQWGPPAFLYTVGGSFGLQFGAEAVDLILLVMTQKGLKGLLSEKLTLGGDIAITAGPVGRHAEASVDVLIQGEIYSYSRSKGIFGGVSIKGTIISSDADANLAYYGKSRTAKNILLFNRDKKIPQSGRQLMKVFNQLAPLSIIK